MLATIELAGRLETLKLGQKSILIGRSRSADVRLQHPSISGRHARIVWEDGEYRVRDAGSKNGMYVAGLKVGDLKVTDGLAVRIGKATLTFENGGGQARAECLQRLQPSNPGVSGISPPPAPGSGLTPTAVSDRVRAFFAASSSLAVSAGLHALIAIVLSLCVYRGMPGEEKDTMSVSFERPKAPFEAPVEVGDGDGNGVPWGDAAMPPRPDVAAMMDMEEAESGELAFEQPGLESAVSSPAKRKGTGGGVVGPNVSRRGAMRKLELLEMVPDDGTWERMQEARGRKGVRPPLEIKRGTDLGEIVRGNVNRGRPGGWQTVALMEPGEVMVITGQYDHVQRVMDRLRIRYTLCNSAKLGEAKLSKVRVMILNCPGELDAAGQDKLRKYVDNGGWLISTDWSLSAVIDCFPGYLTQAGLTGETWCKIGPNAEKKDHPLLTDVFNFTGEMPKWYLEARSFLFKVTDKENVTTLITSDEQEKKYGSGTVAVVFPHKKGRILHIISHLMQVSNDPKAHYAMYQLVANFMVEAGSIEKGEAAKK